MIRWEIFEWAEAARERGGDAPIPENGFDDDDDDDDDDEGDDDDDNDDDDDGYDDWRSNRIKWGCTQAWKWLWWRNKIIMMMVMMMIYDNYDDDDGRWMQCKDDNSKSPIVW